jgi:hypothetical protein
VVPNNNGYEVIRRPRKGHYERDRLCETYDPTFAIGTIANSLDMYTNNI